MRRPPASTAGDSRQVRSGFFGHPGARRAGQDVARKAKIVAAIRGLDLFEYIDGILRPAVERDHAAAIRDEAKGAED
jgi:hypothetical protein